LRPDQQFVYTVLIHNHHLHYII